MGDESSLMLLGRTINNVMINKHKSIVSSIDAKLDSDISKIEKANEEIANYSKELNDSRQKLDAYIDAAENVKSQLSFQLLSKSFESFVRKKPKGREETEGSGRNRRVAP